MIRAVAPVLLGCLLVAPAWASAPAQGQTKAATKPAADLIDLNSATAEQLETLPGVGPATSKKIIENRPYKSIDDLKTAGLIPAAIEKIRPLATVKPVEAAKSSTRKAESKAAEPASKAESKKAEAATKGETKKAEAAPAGGLIDLNSAKADEIETLPGIGPATAKAIIDGRPYKTIDDLDKVKGLGPAKIAAIKDKVKIGEAAEPKGKAAAAETKTAAQEKEKAKTAAKTTTAAPGKKVNINTASKDELDALPGIGPVKAQAIIDGRPFKTLDSLKDVKGIGDVTFEKLKELITID